jgi:hypothetical protein
MMQTSYGLLLHLKFPVWGVGCCAGWHISGGGDGVVVAVAATSMVVVVEQLVVAGIMVGMDVVTMGDEDEGLREGGTGRGREGQDKGKGKGWREAVAVGWE